MQVSDILRKGYHAGFTYLTFWCPGCEEPHAVLVYREGSPKPNAVAWEWNGDYVKPTFKPSILITNGCKCPGFVPGTPCWCTYNAANIAKGEPPSEFTCGRCHTFVTDGRIQFLGDCTHKLAGTTVDLPSLPDNLRDEP